MLNTATFTGLSEESILEYADFLAALLKEEAPSLNLNRGSVLYRQLLRPAAAMHCFEAADRFSLRNKWNLHDIVNETVPADIAVITRVLSNYNVDYSAGTSATGYIEIVVSTLASVVVPADTVFTAGDVAFTNTLSYTAVVSEDDVVYDTDVAMYERGDGNYAFVIPVFASATGASGNVKAATAFTMSPSPSMFIAAYAQADFSGGSDADSTTSLLTRASNGISAKVLANRATAQAALFDVVTTSTASSMVGMGDVEMTRDQRGLLGQSSGGKVDAYLRTQAQLEEYIIQADGEETDETTHEWTITIPYDDLYGAIRLVKVTKRDDNQIVLSGPVCTWGVKAGLEQYDPDVDTAEEAAFSSYQTLAITFTDVNDYAEYDVYLDRLPNIETAQAYCNDTSSRDLLADWLVKAPVPAITSVTLSVKYPSALTVDEDAVIAAVVNAVNSKSFVEELSVTTVIEAAQSVLPSGAYVSLPVELISEIILPSRESLFIRSDRAIVVPSSDDYPGVTKNTVAFFTDATRVQVNTTAI